MIRAPSVCCSAIKQQRLVLNTPKVSIEDFLFTLQKQQLPQTVSALKEYIELLE